MPVSLMVIPCTILDSDIEVFGQHSVESTTTGATTTRATTTKNQLRHERLSHEYYYPFGGQNCQ